MVKILDLNCQKVLTVQFLLENPPGGTYYII